MARNKEEEGEDEITDNPFTTARVERRFTDFVKSKGLNTNELLRMFYEGKLKMVEDDKKEVSPQAEPVEITPKREDKIHKTIEEAVSKQIESYMTTTMENFQKTLTDLQEKAKKADELEKERLLKEIDTLKEKMKYMEEHKEDIKKELMEAEMKRKMLSESAENKKITELEQKVDMLLKKLETNPIQQYKEGLQTMTELKKTLDETFKQLFPDYIPKKDNKTDWENILKLFNVVSPMFQNLIGTALGTWSTMKQVDVLLARADKAKSPEIAERYLKQADMLMDIISRRVERSMPPPIQQMPVQSGSSQTVNPPVTPGATQYEDTLVSMLSSIGAEDINKFKSGELSLIPLVKEALPSIVPSLRNNPALVEQIKVTTPEVVIGKIKQVRPDIVIDGVLEERIKTELNEIKKLFLDALNNDGSQGGGYGF